MNNLFITLTAKNEPTELSVAFKNKYDKEAIFVSRFYSRLLTNCKIENLRRITIELVDSVNKEYVIPNNKQIKVCRIGKYFDLYVLSNELKQAERYKILLDIILISLLENSEKLNWPKEIFQNAYKTVLDTGFNNEYIIVKEKLSKDKIYGASIGVKVDIVSSSIFLLLENKLNMKTLQVELIKLSSYEDNFTDILKYVKWINNEELLISNKENEINIKFSVKTMQSEVFITPKVHTLDYLQDELQLLNPYTPQNKYLEILNKRMSMF
jgi:hypothetical protein